MTGGRCSTLPSQVEKLDVKSDRLTVRHHTWELRWRIMLLGVRPRERWRVLREGDGDPRERSLTEVMDCSLATEEPPELWEDRGAKGLP